MFFFMGLFHERGGLEGFCRRRVPALPFGMRCINVGRRIPNAPQRGRAPTNQRAPRD